MTTKVILTCANSAGVNNTANTTTYAAALGGTPSSLTNENRTRVIVREAGTLSNLYVRVITNTCSGTTTYNMRDNAVTKTQTVSFTTGQTGEQEDISNSDATTAGHFYDVQIVPAGGSTGINTTTIMRLLYATTTNTATRLVSTNILGYAGVSTTYYNPLGGISGAGSTSDIFKCRQRLVGTFQSMFMNVFSNTRTTTTTVNGRLNGSNATVMISATTTQTGYLEDVTHSDSVVVGDDYDITIVTGSDSAHNIAIDNMGISFVNTAGYMQLVASSSLSGATPNTTSQVYFPIGGYIGTGNVGVTTEANEQMKAGSTSLFSQLTTVISTNTGAVSTLRFRKNAGNGNQTVSVGSSATGVFTDTVNKDGVVASDEINYAFTAGSASLTTITSIASWALPGVLMSETTSISSTIPRKVARKIPVAISL
jgi:hypothetical protein